MTKHTKRNQTECLRQFEVKKTQDGCKRSVRWAWDDRKGHIENCGGKMESCVGVDIQ